MNKTIADFQDLNAEMGILSLALKDINVFYDIMSKVDQNDFLNKKNHLLFVTLKQLHDKGVKAFDSVLVLDELKQNGVSKIISADYIRTITQDILFDRSNLNIYCSRLIEARTKYSLYLSLQDSLSEIIESLSDKNISSIDLMGKVQNSILDLSVESKAIKEPQSFADGLLEYIESRRDAESGVIGVPTGFPILDTQIDGLIPGTLFIVAARKKMGKSAFLTNMACNMAVLNKKPLLYVDTEMTYPEWRNRVLAILTGIEERVIKHGGYNDETYSMLMRKAEKIVKDVKLFHQYMPGYSTDKITALFKKYKIKEDIGVGFFDYIKEPDSSSVDRQRKEYQILGDVTTRLKDLAGELNIPFVSAIQLNRQGDVADSDRVARYGDVISFWQHQKSEDIESKGHRIGGYKLVIKDSRRGGQTSEDGIGFYFHKKQISIREVPVADQLFGYREGEVVNYGDSDYENSDLE